MTTFSYVIHGFLHHVFGREVMVENKTNSNTKVGYEFVNL